MRAGVKCLLFLVVLASVLLPGCTEQSQNPSIPAGNASKDIYVNEFYLGYDQQAAAKGLFNDATDLWDLEDYPNASEYMARAGDEYSAAEGHYHNMTFYAGNDSERAFAQGLEEAASDMSDATAKYILSLDASVAGDNSSSVAYFDDGQGLVDTSMDTLNRSLEIMPDWLEG